MAPIQYTEKRMSQQVPTWGEGRNRTSGANTCDRTATAAATTIEAACLSGRVGRNSSSDPSRGRGDRSGLSWGKESREERRCPGPPEIS